MISITVETMGYYENLNVTSCLKSVRDRVELALGWVGEITFKFRLRGLGRQSTPGRRNSLVDVFNRGFSGGQCRTPKRLGFDLWVGKIFWRRAWQPTPVFLHGESHGQRSLAHYSSWGCKRIRQNWSNWVHRHTPLLERSVTFVRSWISQI